MRTVLLLIVMLETDLIVGLFFWNWRTANPHSITQWTTVPHRSFCCCTRNEHCRTGLFCDRHYRKCRPLRTVEQPCRADSHCSQELDCLFGRCMTRVPARTEGARCKSNFDCPHDHCCARKHGMFVCKRLLALGANCFIPDGGLSFFLNQLCPCQSGLRCSNGDDFDPASQLSSYSCR